jgi:prevent-host-death family protein
VTGETIGARQLQAHASRIVKNVQQDAEEHRVSVRGRDTGVVISLDARRKPARRGASAAEMLASPLYTDTKPEEVARGQIAIVEAGRDASGGIRP